MKYKISETPLKLRAYGRNVQSMVEYAKTIEDREERTRIAQQIVRIMVNLNPKLKEQPDYKQKLWDHLFHIADFDFDVESPYPIPQAEVIEAKVQERMAYPTGKPRLRQYGIIAERMIEKAIAMEDEEQRKIYVNQIANAMKLFLRPQDRESNPEVLITSRINELSQGRLKVKPEDIRLTKLPPMKEKEQRNSGKRRRNTNRRRRKNN